MTTSELHVRSHVSRDLLQTAALFKNERQVAWEYVSNGLQYVDPGTSPVVRVPIRPHVALSRDGGTFRVAARPPRPHSRVALQAYDRERFRWVTVGRGRLDASSRERLVIAVEPPVHVRAVVRGRGGWRDGVSPVLAVSR